MEKNNRETLEGFKQRFEELAGEYKQIETEWMGEFEGTTEYHEYMDLKVKAETDPSYQVVLEDKYSKWAELEKKKEELAKKIEAYEKVVKDAARKLYEELSQKVEALEAKLKTNKDYIAKLEQEIKEQQAKIDNIKASEAYKNGDEQTLLEVESLEKHLATTISDKQEKESRLNPLVEQIETLKKEQEALAVEFGEDIKVKSVSQEEVEASQAGQKEEESEAKSAPETKTNNRVNMHNGVISGGVANPAAEQGPIEAQPKDEKQEFKELYSRVKSGKASKEDLDKLANIMQDPENYEKYGISTGIVFNKSKVLLLAIGKGIDGSGIKSWKDLKNIMENPEEDTKKEAKLKAIVAKDRDSLSEEEQAAWDKAAEDLKRYDALRKSLSTYNEVSTDRMKKRWSWAVDFKDEQPAALPAQTEMEQPGAPSTLTENLGGLVKDEPDGEMPPAHTTVDVPEQTK